MKCKKFTRCIYNNHIENGFDFANRAPVIALIKELCIKRTDLFPFHGGNPRSAALADTELSFPRFQLSPISQSSTKT